MGSSAHEPGHHIHQLLFFCLEAGAPSSRAPMEEVVPKSIAFALTTEPMGSPMGSFRPQETQLNESRSLVRKKNTVTPDLRLSQELPPPPPPSSGHRRSFPFDSFSFCPNTHAIHSPQPRMCHPPAPRGHRGPRLFLGRRGSPRPRCAALLTPRLGCLGCIFVSLPTHNPFCPSTPYARAPRGLLRAVACPKMGACAREVTFSHYRNDAIAV